MMTEPLERMVMWFAIILAAAVIVVLLLVMT
jgi:hypothetical protein